MINIIIIAMAYAIMVSATPADCGCKDLKERVDEIESEITLRKYSPND